MLNSKQFASCNFPLAAEEVAEEVLFGRYQSRDAEEMQNPSGGDERADEKG